ncbi:MAG TPA: hypothetical protein DCY56_06000 [Candidatus Omnitrophica bacterium]|nr:hypothetical protein [Candidatus Omnitrophota bacterium]
MLDESFEHLAAQYVALLARSIPQENISLVFSSLLCARSPDLGLIWHSGYRKKHINQLIVKGLWSVISGLVEGFARLSTNFRSFGYALYGKINDTILVVSLSCGSEASDGQFKTQYIPTQIDDAIFVFGTTDRFKQKTHRVKKLTFKDKSRINFFLIKGGITAFLKLRGNVLEKNLLLLEWLSWALSLKWLNNYYFEKSLSDAVERHPVKKIGCIHEMHAYARIVWRIAFKYGLKSYTIQHAAITAGKRWYFCYPEEKVSGAMLPEVMYVYEDKIANLLRPYFENTKFILGCSYRYAHWKDVRSIKKQKGKYYLFVGALPEFDNQVLIASLKKLLNSAKEEIPIRVRLHPLAKLSGSDREWLRVKIRQNIIQASKGISLRTDIEQALVVIGMSTTVLEEALLMACPVVQLTHSDYLEYIDLNGIEGVIKKDYQGLLLADLIALKDAEVNHEQARSRLGLGQPLVTYQGLFLS